MRTIRASSVLVAAALLLGVGCSTGAKTAGSTTRPGATSTPSNAVIPQPPANASSKEVNSAPSQPAQQAAGPQSSPGKQLSAQDATQAMLALSNQIRQAENTPNGPRALTKAEVQTMLDALKKKFGINVPQP